MRRRMDGPYRDLVALIQFGNEAYVVTPFTTDYENVMLSIRLISDPKEWGRFNDWGTTIVQGIDQGVQLFKAFDFVNASGNLMILFTDGRDSELNRQGRPLDALVAEARKYRIPVYMIRTAYNQKFGRVEQDKIWKGVIERTGGRFYAASDEDSINVALREIDRLSSGAHRRARVQRAAAALQRLRAGGRRAMARCRGDEAGRPGLQDVSVRYGVSAFRRTQVVVSGFSRTREGVMKGIAGYVITAVIIALAAGASFAFAAYERDMAAAEESLATLRYSEAADRLTAAGEYREYRPLAATRWRTCGA